MSLRALPLPIGILPAVTYLQVLCNLRTEVVLKRLDPAHALRLEISRVADVVDVPRNPVALATDDIEREAPQI